MFDGEKRFHKLCRCNCFTFCPKILVFFSFDSHPKKRLHGPAVPVEPCTHIRSHSLLVSIDDARLSLTFRPFYSIDGFVFDCIVSFVYILHIFICFFFVLLFNLIFSVSFCHWFSFSFSISLPMNFSGFEHLGFHLLL